MLIKVMVFFLVAAFSGLFFLKGPGGEAILSLEDFKPDVPKIESDPLPTKVYRWQDENGVWQFSNQPADENQGELVELDGKINTMPAIDVTTLNSARNKSGADRSSGMSMPTGLTTVSGSQLEEMMDTVNHLQETVDNRKAEIDQLSVKQ